MARMTEPVVPMVMVLAGGELLLRGSAVHEVARALRLAVRLAARDGIGVSRSVRELEAAATLALARARSAVGTPEYRERADLAESDPEDLIDTGQAARLMDTSTRNIRALCQRRTLSTARRVGGKWVVDRADVLHYLERKAS
jgi:Helix-turn-helix domain